MVSSVQSCYSNCNQQISFNTTLQPRTTCEAHRNSSVVCAVSVTFSSNKENIIGILYFTPNVLYSRLSFVETQVSVSTGVLSIHIFHECFDCDILEDTRNIIASIQSVPKLTSITVTRMRELFPFDNNTHRPIECYKDDDEKETFNQYQSCLLEINSTSTTRSYRDSIGSVGVTLQETTTLDDKRAFKTVYIECTQSHCNTKNTAQAALRILADTGLAQHFYDLSSSATVFSHSIIYIFAYILILVNII